MILFFGLLRPYKGIDTLLEAFAEVEGAELWIVGIPRMDVEPLRAPRRRGAGPRPLRHPLRRGRRDPGDLPPRRPRRPALPRHRAVRRPLHRPRLRQADGPERRRRLPRGRRAGRRPARPARGPAALAAALSELIADEAARDRARRRRPRRRRRALLLGRDRRARPSPSYEELLGGARDDRSLDDRSSGSAPG